MKKLLAILLSALMLCAMIPFATVAATDEPTIVLSIVDELEEVNAGDTFQIDVNLANNPGLIAATVEILYDHDVFELVTYYDEDEEAWFPEIEVGSTWSASSNKYIMFGPIDEDTGAAKKCVVSYIRGTASSNCTKEYFFTATFKVKDDAISGDYDLVISYKDTDFVNIDKQFVPFAKGEDATIHVNGTEPEVPTCKHEYDNACDVDCNLCYEGREVEHNVVAVEAVESTCETAGNIAYWYCDVCGMAWLDAECTKNTNLKAVKLPLGDHEYLYACDQYCMNCGEKTNAGAKHDIVHVEAKEAISCIEFGNKEYWHCNSCGAAWLDEAGRYQTNMMSVLTAGPCISNAEYACQDGECINCSLPYAADVEHQYTNAHDASCNVCGTVRELVLAAEEIVLADGNSITEIKGGLAFKFNAAVNGITFNEEYIADYTNATVTIDGVEYKLITMGAIVNNKSYANQTLDNVDDMYVKNVEAVKVFEDDNGATSYAVRVINIPAEHLDTEITARSYFVYENAEGEQITVYGADWATSYNAELNG